MAAQLKIEKECSLSDSDWIIYGILFHPENKVHSLKELNECTLEQVLDYKEALDAISLLRTAANKDAEHEQKLRGG